MEIIPAIDLLEGRVVRLLHGSFEQVTVYARDPIAQASAFVEAGASRIHVVDLDGARTGVPGNVDVIRRIVGLGDVRVQIGGGVRSNDAVRAWRDAGADRVVIGTLAIEDAAEAAKLASDWPNGIVVALDARNGEVRIRGWAEGAGRRVDDVAREVDGWGIGGILYTDVSRDGASVGPDTDGTARLQHLVSTTVIASGGIGTLDHLRALRSAGVRATVCGRALYENAFSLEAAIAAVRAS